VRWWEPAGAIECVIGKWGNVMSILGAAGWSAIGRQYAIYYLWGLVFGVIALLVALLLLVLWFFGVAQIVQKIAEYIMYVLMFISLLLLGTTTIVVGWKFLKDLGHNFYVKWKSAGARVAGKGLLADLKTCGGALAKSIAETFEEKAGWVRDWARSFFKW
jgi:hypothetical protein